MVCNVEVQQLLIWWFRTLATTKTSHKLLCVIIILEELVAMAAWRNGIASDYDPVVD